MIKDGLMKEMLTLGKGFPEPVEILPGYTDFFEGLKRIACSGEISQSMGRQINGYVMSWLKEHTLDGFNRYNDEKYVRNYIGRCPYTAWEAIVMTWKKGNATTIHGHPKFAGYHFSDGTFMVETFEKISDGAGSPGKVRKVDSVIIDRPTAFFAVGDTFSFDNHIHRLTCLSDTGHSLHVYSDDALKGEVFVLLADN